MRISAIGSSPAENDASGRVEAGREQEARKVAGCNSRCCTSHCKADDGQGITAIYVPRALVETSRGPG